MKKVSLSRLALSTALVAALLIMALLVYLGFTRDTQLFQTRTPPQVIPVTTYDHQVIANADSPTGVTNVYTWTMEPSPHEGISLGIYTYHQYVRILVDDVELYRISDASQNEITATPGATWSFLPIYQADAGKEFRVEITPVYESAMQRDPEIYMGAVQDIFMTVLKRELPQIILCVLTVLVGFIFLIVGLYGYYSHKRGKTLIAHGVFSIMLGIWRLLDIRTTPMLFPEHTVFLYYCSVCMLTLCAVPLIKALSRRVSRICGQILNACCVLCASVCLIQHVLQILGILDLRQMLILTHASIVISSLIIIPALIYDAIVYRKPAKEQHNKVLLFVCVPGALVDVILFYFVDSTNLVFTLAAHLIYILIVGTQTLIRTNRQETEMEKSRMGVLRSQIQPHFLFNSLTAIAQLCEKDPALAKQAAITFSEYYRGNLRAIDHAEPIPFAQELDHLKMYLFIEQLRFGDSLNVVFDIESTNFVIPALTIQPLVENAVKHGVGAKEEGGTVTICVKERADSFDIIISDDGVGFDPAAIDNRDRQHVGMDNVKNRLLLMCDAVLRVKSAPGEGTCVTISMPKEGLDQ